MAGIDGAPREGGPGGRGVGGGLARAKRLTPEQSSAVHSLQEDSGYSRAEALAWVLAFGGTK